METYKLSDLCEILDSKRKPLSALQRAKKQGIYPYYGAQGIIDHLDDYLLDGEYLLVAEDGANLETRNQPIANIAKGKIWVNNHAHVLGSNGKCPLNLLGFILNNMNISPYVTGCAQPKLNQENLRNIEIELPSHIDSIASILSSLDRKIELNNKINADLEEMAQAIFKNWFVDFEPFKDGKFVDSELGMIPEGWKVGCLGDIAEITSGKRPPKKSKDKTKELFIPLIGASDIMGFTSDVLYERPILVIGRVGTHGVVQRFQEKCWPSDNTLVIESRYYNYVYQLLKGIDYSAINRGSTQPLITQTDVKNTDVIIAPENVLKEYESITSTLFSKHRANIKENSRLSLLRDTLLPRLMSGELEVPE